MAGFRDRQYVGLDSLERLEIEWNGCGRVSAIQEVIRWVIQKDVIEALCTRRDPGSIILEAEVPARGWGFVRGTKPNISHSSIVTGSGFGLRIVITFRPLPSRNFGITCCVAFGRDKSCSKGTAGFSDIVFYDSYKRRNCSRIRQWQQDNGRWGTMGNLTGN